MNLKNITTSVFYIKAENYTQQLLWHSFSSYPSHPPLTCTPYLTHPSGGRPGAPLVQVNAGETHQSLPPV